MRLAAAIAGGLALLAASAGFAQAPAPSPPPRAELPIEAVQLSDGVIRYGVRILVGGKPVLAGIDTGAAGLRIMPDVAAGMTVSETPTAEEYGFGSGARLHGLVGKIAVEFGPLKGETRAHLVKQVDCQAGRPQCPGRLGLGYGFLGDGLPGEGFRVLIGGSMGLSTVDSPWTTTGVKRWIITLPRPGETGPGKLILNPSDEELAGFIFAKLVGGYAERDGGGLHDAVLGCLRQRVSGRRVCGLTTFDTGAYLIRVLNAPSTLDPFKAGEPLALDFLDQERRTLSSLHMTTGGTAQVVAFGRAPVRQPVVQLGAAPYFAYSVLYDPGGKRIGLKARAPVEGLPVAAPP